MRWSTGGGPSSTWEDTERQIRWHLLSHLLHQRECFCLLSTLRVIKEIWFICWSSFGDLATLYLTKENFHNSFQSLCQASIFSSSLSTDPHQTPSKTANKPTINWNTVCYLLARWSHYCCSLLDTVQCYRQHAHHVQVISFSPIGASGIKR